MVYKIPFTGRFKGNAAAPREPPRALRRGDEEPASGVVKWSLWRAAAGAGVPRACRHPIRPWSRRRRLVEGRRRADGDGSSRCFPGESRLSCHRRRPLECAAEEVLAAARAPPPPTHSARDSCRSDLARICLWARRDLCFSGETDRVQDR